jgi:hypothetical protein
MRIHHHHFYYICHIMNMLMVPLSLFVSDMVYIIQCVVQSMNIIMYGPIYYNNTINYYNCIHIVTVGFINGCSHAILQSIIIIILFIGTWLLLIRLSIVISCILLYTLAGWPVCLQPSLCVVSHYVSWYSL